MNRKNTENVLSLTFDKKLVYNNIKAIIQQKQTNHTAFEIPNTYKCTMLYDCKTKTTLAGPLNIKFSTKPLTLPDEMISVHVIPDILTTSH